jgi:hypothetical protein
MRFAANAFTPLLQALSYRRHDVTHEEARMPDTRLKARLNARHRPTASPPTFTSRMFQVS